MENSKINDEGVVVVQDDHGEPIVVVRKSTNNGGKVQLFKLLPMGFSDVSLFLKQLAGQTDKKQDGK